MHTGILLVDTVLITPVCKSISILAWKHHRLPDLSVSREWGHKEQTGYCADKPCCIMVNPAFIAAGAPWMWQGDRKIIAWAYLQNSSHKSGIFRRGALRSFNTCLCVTLRVDCKKSCSFVCVLACGSALEQRWADWGFTNKLPSIQHKISSTRMLPTLEQSTLTTFSCFTLHIVIIITINTSSYNSQRM